MSINDTLSNFINKLIEESFQGILLGELEAEKILDDLKITSTLSNSDFVNKFLNKEIIRNEILSLFPKDIANDKSSVDALQPYTPASPNIEENPKIKELTNYSMIQNVDYINFNKNIVITAQGYSNIFTVVSFNLAIKKKFYIQEVMKRGIPTLFVDSGKINAKLLIEDPHDDIIKQNLSSGLYYTLYKKNADSSRSILSEGLSKNLKIMDNQFINCSYATLVGFIDIPEANYYTFSVKAPENTYLYINDSYYNPFINDNIFLEKGLKKFSLIYENNFKKLYNIDITFNIPTSTPVPLTDSILYYLNKNSTNPNQITLNSNITSNMPNNLTVKTFSANTLIDYHISNLVSTIEINYKLIR